MSDVDWDVAHARVAAAEAATAAAYTVDEATAARLLVSRARRLAEPRWEKASRGHRVDILVFVVARARYALDTSAVLSAAPLRQLTAVPGAPSLLRGIAVVGGELLPVVDLRPVLGLPVAGISDLATGIVVGRASNAELVVLADRVVEVASVETAKLQDPPNNRAPHQRACLADGTTLLDAGSLLEDPRLDFGAGQATDDTTATAARPTLGTEQPWSLE